MGVDTAKASISGEDNRRSKDKKSEEKVKEVKPSTKIVIRRLPPKLSKDEFLEIVGPLADHDYFQFVESDHTLEPHAFSRAYINFLSEEEVVLFTSRFDGYVFVDERGNEYQAIVEFAPYQRYPKVGGKTRKDPKTGTIEAGPEFQSFLEALENPTASSGLNPESYLEELEAKEKELKAKEMTPLLEFIRDKKAEKARFREERKEARRRRDDERRKARDEERKRKKDSAEKIVSDKTSTDRRKDSFSKDDRGGENEGSIRQSGSRGSNNDREKTKDKNKDRIKEDRSGEKDKRSDEDRNQRRQRERRERKRDKATPSAAASSTTSSTTTTTASTKTSKMEGKPVDDVIKSLPEAQEGVKRSSSPKTGKADRGDGHDADDEAAKQLRKEARAKREKERREQRIKNKERPAMEIYRPGMGKFSSQTLKSTSTDGTAAKSSRSNSPEAEGAAEEKPTSADNSKKEESKRGQQRPPKSSQQKPEVELSREEKFGRRGGGRSGGGGGDRSGGGSGNNPDSKNKSGGGKVGRPPRDDRSTRGGRPPRDDRQQRPPREDPRQHRQDRPDEKSEKRSEQRVEFARNRNRAGNRTNDPKHEEIRDDKAGSEQQAKPEADPQPTETAERKSGKSYLSKRRERQQERAARDQEE